ncbi:MAG: matrixin family metalloprotease [Gemmatimonadaceae bacterium]
MPAKRSLRRAALSAAALTLCAPLLAAGSWHGGHRWHSAGARAAAGTRVSLPRRDSAASRPRTTAASLRGTYLGEILAERDSSLARWPDRVASPVRVWVERGSPTLRGWRAGFPAEVRAAFGEWSAQGIPVRFAFVSDPARAEVRVRWVERLGGDSCGETTWTSDAAGWMRRGDITLAMRSSDGVLQDEEDIHAMALHEVGHLLGLGHTSDTTAIMAPWVAANGLSAVDRATVRVLYALPPGPFALGATD